MQYREAPPSLALTDVVEAFWELEAPVALAPARTELVVPDGRSELIVHLGDRFIRRDGENSALQGRMIFAAPFAAPLELVPTGVVHVFGARLRPGAAALVVQSPLAPLLGATPELAAFWGESHALVDELASAGSFSRRVAVFTRRLNERLAAVPRSRRTAAFRVVQCAARLAAAPHPRIDALAADAGWSRRHLERMFAENVGLEARTLLAIERFQRVFAALDVEPKPPLARVAAAAGYADQSHLVRDFHRFAGRTPSRYLDERHALSDCFTGLTEHESIDGGESRSGLPALD